MDETEKELIRDRTDIVELIAGYTTLKPSGNRFKGLCPFHQEKTPSFTVDPERRRYHCFGCQASGDVFTFLEKIENLTFPEAAERLAMRAGITLSRRGTNPEEARRQQSERDRLFAANAAALRFFRQAYRRATLAQEYAAKRGLVQETMEDFGIGYAPDDWSQLAHFLIEREKVHPEDAIRAGLITASRVRDGEFTDRFRGRFLFPIVDVQERVIGFGGRLIVDKADAPKYLNSPETPIFSKSRTLYALNRARKAIQEQDIAVIVEGYMDVVASHQAGIRCVVATLGTSMTADHVSLLRRYTKNVVLSFDADNAGVKAALKAAELITAAGEDMTLKVLSLPPGEDPDSMIRKGDAAGFRKAIDNAMTVPEFQLGMLKRQSRLEDPYGCELFLREAAKIIAPLPNSLTINMLTKRIASTREVLRFLPESQAEAVLRQEVARQVGERGYRPTDFTEPSSNPSRSSERFADRNGKRPFRQPSSRAGWRERPPEPPPVPFVPQVAEEAERTLIRAIMAEEFLPEVRKRFPATKGALLFVNPLTERFLEIVEPALRGEGDPQDRLIRHDDPDLNAYVDAVLFSPVWSDARARLELSQEMIGDAILELRKRRINADADLQAEVLARVAARGGTFTPEDDEILRQITLRKSALRNGRQPAND
ncbi:MAG: DNA primase [Capsulimonadales bacterium]|nr:DNA primase [Capsulimonadales bacterium]